VFSEPLPPCPPELNLVGRISPHLDERIHSHRALDD
jgi:hypothetical protein